MPIVIDVKLSGGVASTKLKECLDNLTKMKKVASDVDSIFASMADNAERMAASFKTVAASAGQVKSATSNTTGGYKPMYKPLQGNPRYGQPRPYRGPNTGSVPLGSINTTPTVSMPTPPSPIPLAASSTIANVISLFAEMQPEIIAFTAAFALAIDTMKKYTDQAVMGGMSGFMGASSVNSAFGINPASIGRNLMNGYGPIAAGGAGVNPFGGPFGDNDYNKKGLKILEWIATSSTFAEARRRSEMAGDPDAARFQLMDPNIRRQLFHPQGSAFDSGQGMKDITDLQGALGVFMTKFSNAIINFAAPLIHVVADVTRLASAIDGFTKPFQDILGAIFKWTNLWTYIGMALDKLMDLFHIDHKNAIDKNTDAVNQNTRALHDGIYGGGPRANMDPSRLQPYSNKNYSQVPQGVA